VKWLRRIGVADTITLCNGVFGTLAITYVLDGEHIIASLFILLAVIMDGLDGRVARRYGSPHEFGHFLDSISDAVSFCLAPGLIIYNNFYDKTLGSAWTSLPNAVATAGTMFFVVFGLLRLARFAGKDYKMRRFLGLPTPSSAMTVLTICLLWGNESLNPFSLGSYWPLAICAVVILSFLMISDIRYPKIRGKFVGVVSAAMVAGMLPLMIYVISPATPFPHQELLIVFLLLLMTYIIGGPIYEARASR